MGGNALKKVATRRIDASEYRALAQKVVNTIRLSGLVDRAADVAAYSTKPDFGDLDIIVTAEPGQYRPLDVAALFNPTEIVRNGADTSFDVDGVQVDVKYVEPESFDFASVYFSYNDLGNFVGRTAHRLGFKFGHNGLWYVLRDPENPDYQVAELLVTQNPGSAVSFLGFEYRAWVQGFATPEEIFAYAASSQWFDPRQFLLVNRSSTARRRDRTRKMYTQMLEWVNQQYALEDDSKPTPCNRQYHLVRAFDAFPLFQAAYNQALTTLEFNRRLRSVFNGDNVGSWFDLEGRELGFVMSRLRDYFQRNELGKWIGQMPVDQFQEFLYHLQLVEPTLWLATPDNLEEPK